jgi:hypothetical protein
MYDKSKEKMNTSLLTGSLYNEIVQSTSLTTPRIAEKVTTKSSM